MRWKILRTLNLLFLKEYNHLFQNDNWLIAYLKEKPFTKIPAILFQIPLKDCVNICIPKTHITKKHDKEWLLSAVALNTTFVYCPSCYIILPCVYTKNHEKKFKQRTVVIRCNSYRLLHSDSYSMLTWCYINWCIDTEETHRIYFHKFFGLFFFLLLLDLSGGLH